MEMNREHDLNNDQVRLEPPESGNRTGSCDATEQVNSSPLRRSAEDVGVRGKTSEQDILHAREATSANREMSEVTGVDALQRAITAAADNHIMESMTPHDPLNRTLMANIEDHGDFNLPSTTPFRGRPGEEPNAPPLALHSTSLPVPLGDAMVVDSPLLDTSPVLQEPTEAPRIQAFAKLEFDDGQFYMNTYSVILGRDIRAARAAYQREQQERESTKELMRGGQSASGGDASQTAFRVKRGGSTKMNSSVVSESGGIIGVDDPADDSRRKKSKKSKSTTSSSQQISRKNSIVQPTGHTDYQALAQPSNSDGAHPVDPSSLLPSPEECPLIPIHPPAVTTGTGSHKGISRKHAKIAYNFDTHIFEVEIKGKNGAFVDDQWYAPGDVRPLKSGSFIQIGGVGIRFLLPEVVLGQGDAEEQGYNHDDKEMSFAFENGRGVEMSSGADEGNEDDDEGGESGDEDDEEEEDEVDGEERDEDDKREEEEAQESPSPEPLPQPPPVRRGPGRPPKNGISKRERELAEKEAKEKAKAREKGKRSVPPVTKNKVGRPRKNSRPETPPPKPEKRKYTKRKVADATGSPTKTKKEKDPKEPKPQKEKKEKRPPKPPRSPSPVFDESKLTAEELQKPQASYVILIHEALTNSKTGAMSLPQIYRAIERKYPFYKLRVQTTGWQSSVRHNLSQHHAFRKVERDGKGWLWGIVPGVSIEKERKKRMSPPPLHHHQQPLQQQPVGRGMPLMQQPMIPAPPGLGKGPAGPPMHPIPPNGSTGVRAGYGMAYPSPQGGPPGGPNAIPTPIVNVQGATFVNSTPSGQIPQRQQAPQSYSGKTTVTGPHSMQENRPPSIQSPTTASARPPPSTTGPTPPQTPQNQPRSIKLNDKTLQAIASFQTALVSKLTANGSKDAEAIVQSAVNRALGIADKSSVPGKEDPQEVAIMKAVSGLLNQINNKPSAPSSSSSTSGGAENKNTPRSQQQQQQQQGRPTSRSGGVTQQQSPGQGSRQGQGQHAVQAQLVRFLSTALTKGSQKISPQPGGRPPSASNASVGVSGGGGGGAAQTRTNGTAAPRPPLPGAPPPRATGATVPINAHKSPTTSKPPQQQQSAAANASAQKQMQAETQSPPPVAGVKRPLENGDAAEGQPEAKKVAVASDAAGGEEGHGA
ncbi:hypothetical protein FGG08_006406 [Glutinoglossum americanum]|uniref:Uncharacterized protein n=1 Tax=Glutinoglossum americanum TaxID=1670608 RepID=A0A9P8HYD2_9PEZI|nr:hypothetical protein FGG08_006406 [Glutinoglossum americanum]